MALAARRSEVRMAGVCRHGPALIAWWLILTRLMCHFS
jgi:hypothetical protein